MALRLDTKITLNNGRKMPLLGLGTWNLNGKIAHQAVLWALDLGYRLIDTAMIYRNEREIGKALKETSVAREEIFITSKVWNFDQGFEPTLKAFNKSLRQLNLEYLDLYLIHWPATPQRYDSWRALEKIYKEGQVRSIGVSNFTISHIKDLLEMASIIPVVNQFELSPFLYQKELILFCKEHGIAVEAYSPLTRGKRLNNDTLQIISKAYNKTTAQILIRWGLQHNFIEIPKSGSKQHLKENIDIFDFEITSEDMAKIDSLDEGFRIGDDPHLLI